MHLIDDLRVALLKKRARALLMQIRHRQDAYDCGHGLVEYIAPEIATMKNEFNAVLDQLAALDSNTPKGRL